MAQPVYLPKVGMTMEEGTLTRWLVEEGAMVSQGQPLFEMETEKVDMDVESEAAGILRRLVAEGTVLKPGAVVGALLAPGEVMPASFPEQSAVAVGVAEERQGQPAPPAPSASAGDEQRLRVTPVARRLATEKGIDLTTIRGSGPEGRILERDVMAAIDRPPPPAPAAQGQPAPAEMNFMPYSSRRRTIGERMQQSLATMAQLTLSSETPVDEALTMIHGLNREWRGDGMVVSLTAVIVRACALALREHPALNGRLEEGRILLPESADVAIAVDHVAGVMTPVIRDAGALSLREVAGKVRQLAEAVRENRITPDDMTGATFTVTSLEGTSVDAFTPVINPPQAAILGVGRVREVAAFEGPTVVRRQVTTLSLTFDHRLVDGAPAARFLDRVAELLGRPYLLM